MQQVATFRGKEAIKVMLVSEYFDDIPLRDEPVFANVKGRIVFLIPLNERFAWIKFVSFDQ